MTNLPPSLEVQVRELARGIVALLQLGDHIKGPNTSAAVLEQYLGDMAQRTLGWAAKEGVWQCSDADTTNGVCSHCEHFGDWLRSLAGQEDRDGK